MLRCWLEPSELAKTYRWTVLGCHVNVILLRGTTASHPKASGLHIKAKIILSPPVTSNHTELRISILCPARVKNWQNRSQEFSSSCSHFLHLKFPELFKIYIYRCHFNIRWSPATCYLPKMFLAQGPKVHRQFMWKHLGQQKTQQLSSPTQFLQIHRNH
jgi:hypothetical protein